MSENQIENSYIIYVNDIGTDTDGKHIYHFLFSDSPQDVFIEEWAKVPACNIRKDLLIPSEDVYSLIAEVKTDIKFILAQENCCQSMQDSQDGIVALCYEDILNYEQYPEPFRIVIHYGESLSSVQEKLSARDISMLFM